MKMHNFHYNKNKKQSLISPKILKELPEFGIAFIVHIFNAILRNLSFPLQWKTAQIKMILKPGKPPDMASSYRPISPLPILSKVLETLLVKKIQSIMSKNLFLTISLVSAKNTYPLSNSTEYIRKQEEHCNKRRIAQQHL